MEIKFNWFHKYVHLYYVDGLHNYLKSRKEHFLNTHSNSDDLDYKGGKYNASINNPSTESKLLEIHNSIIEKYYHVSPHYKTSTFSIYTQDNTNNVDVFHNHIDDASIVSTCYIDPPNEGGGLEVFFNERPLVLNIEPNIIYMFPAWMLHRPTTQKDNTIRICINWGYESILRPIHKITSDKW